ncbi:MAG: multifunctional CCA addition/repair protein [Zoogloeaceae bacterium]|nr:multifunctional CCA addition/repair protein [Zoogloeaceae bacterium]
MKVYVVGGAVRDELLQRPVQDRDHVVVGSTPEEMLAKGFRPVGKDFPVFLHPQSNEEYALARTERKTAPGYAGFSFHASPDVTLEEDLARRDLTINAIARADDGSLIDPYNGQQDIADRIFRHVGPAFVEDPVRILRIARFAARFTDFSIAPETRALMSEMVGNGEVDALVPERVWQELAKGLMEASPSRMFAVLRECGALQRLLPELDRLFGVPQRAEYHPEIDTGVHVMMVLDTAARRGHALPVRFAALLHDLGKGTTPREEWPRHIAHEMRSVKLVETVSARLKVPAECRDLAVLVARYHGDIHRAAELRADTIVRLLERSDALRRPQRFEQLLQACAADFNGRQGWEEKPYASPALLLRALAAVQSVPAAAIAKSCNDPAQIPERIHAARIAVVASLKSAN